MGELEEYKESMLIEHAELYDRTVKLGTFIHTKKFLSVDKSDQDLLINQHDCMSKYLDVLAKRINKWKIPKSQGHI